MYELEEEFLYTRVNIGLLLGKIKTSSYITFLLVVIVVITISILLKQAKKRHRMAEAVSKTDALTKINNRYSLGIIILMALIKIIIYFILT